MADKRQLSVYISHIRYGLNLCWLIVLLLYFKDLFRSKFVQLLIYISVIWLMSCLALFELVTGLACLIFVITIRVLIYVFRKTNPLTYKVGVVLGFILLMLGGSYEFYQVKQAYEKPVELDYDQYAIVDTTINGNNYINRLDSKKENGVLIYHFFAYKELREEWEKASQVDYKGKDKKGNAVFYTLLRFMSSKGLKKDSIGFSKLSEAEIRAVENGIPNVYYLNHNPIQNRIHQLCYEFDQWYSFGAVNGYSVVMRTQYWLNALHLIQKHWLVGVGTGDVEKEITYQYALDDSKLDVKHRKRAHNQYLTFWVALGLAGFLLFLGVLFYPLFKSTLNHKLLYTLFISIAAIACLTEDTLETQAGVTFFVVFYALILFGFKPTLKQNDTVEASAEP